MFRITYTLNGEDKHHDFTGSARCDIDHMRKELERRAKANGDVFVYMSWYTVP